MAEEVKLFRTWSSPFALRIVWALKLKGIEYKTVFEDLSNKSPLLLQLNPVNKQVPVLVHKGKPISESLVILEYIDETWNHNPLLPEDPYERANARFLAKFGDNKVIQSVWRVFRSQGKGQEEAIPALVENLIVLENELKGKKFFGGETIGLADITFSWMANLMSVLEEITGLNFINEDKFPLLHGWIKLFSDFHVIKENWPPRDKLVLKFRAIREASLAASAPK